MNKNPTTADVIEKALNNLLDGVLHDAQTTTVENVRTRRAARVQCALEEILRAAQPLQATAQQGWANAFAKAWNMCERVDEPLDTPASCNPSAGSKHVHGVGRVWDTTDLVSTPQESNPCVNPLEVLQVSGTEMQAKGRLYFIEREWTYVGCAGFTDIGIFVRPIQRAKAAAKQALKDQQ